MDRERELDELLDREQIRELATRYSFAADGRDFEAVAGVGERWTEVSACYVDDYVKRDGRWYFARRRPSDLQRFMLDQPVGIGKLSLADAWDIHRHRQAEIREQQS